MSKSVWLLRRLPSLHAIDSIPGTTSATPNQQQLNQQPTIPQHFRTSSLFLIPQRPWSSHYCYSLLPSRLLARWGFSQRWNHCGASWIPVWLWYQLYWKLCLLWSWVFFVGSWIVPYNSYCRILQDSHQKTPLWSLFFCCIWMLFPRGLWPRPALRM